MSLKSMYLIFENLFYISALSISALGVLGYLTQWYSFLGCKSCVPSLVEIAPDFQSFFLLFLHVNPSYLFS
jgi:hypothetical protein